MRLRSRAFLYRAGGRVYAVTRCVGAVLVLATDEALAAEDDVGAAGTDGSE